VPEDRSQWQTVDKLCAATHDAIAIDEKEQLYQTMDAPKPQTALQNPTIALDTLLQHFHTIWNRPWYYKEKLIFAAISAYSLLQLYDSPWLRSGLSPQNVYFPEASKRFLTHPDTGAALRCAYISCDHGQPRVPATDAQKYCSELLTSLGTMFLELHFNRSIRTGIQPPEMKASARRFFDEHHAEISHQDGFFDATHFCLFPKPDPRSRLIAFTDEPFREMCHREVIAKLELEMEQMGIKDDIWQV
jgi:hypothetical protein